MKKFRAFTLAEVLITLGIIGVVAAMTLPSLIMNNQKKQWETSFKKNYSVMQNALNQSYADNGIYITGWNYPGSAKNALKKYLNVGRDYGFSGLIDYEKDEHGNVKNRIIKEYKTYDGKRNVETTFFDEGQIVLNDGSLWLFENPYDGTYIIITVDVNGIDKGPNRYGYDLFSFQILNNGRLMPIGSKDSEYKDNEVFCSKSSAHVLNGIGCAARALTEKDYWKNLD